MKLQSTFTTGLFLLTLLTATGQDIRIKGMFFPFLEHSIAVENLTHQNVSVQVLYQNRIELGDNEYYHHRVIPSIRYYFSSEKRFINRLYIEAFYRYAYIKHFPDQSDVPYYNYYSNSFGLDGGKQFFLSDRLLIDFGVGYYYIYSGKEWHNFSDNNRHCLRIDLKFGVALTRKKDK
jgi:hypothetical protein